jgi:ribosomal protein S18 acetylase RimI-like enzyme
MSIIILEEKKSITFSEINALVKSVGWGESYYQTEEKWQRVLSLSHISYARDNERLVGFARIVEDGIMCMVYDVCVHPDYQGRGIGVELMDALIEKTKDKGYVSIGLFVFEGNPKNIRFYGKLGFEQVVGMELKKYMRKL